MTRDIEDDEKVEKELFAPPSSPLATISEDEPLKN
jgi:hypothetical protein